MAKWQLSWLGMCRKRSLEIVLNQHADNTVAEHVVLCALLLHSSAAAAAAVAAAAGACRGNPPEQLLPGAAWNCTAPTLDGEWCNALGCRSEWVPSAAPLAAKCVAGRFTTRQGDCYPYSELCSTCSTTRLEE
jgi:hypothetical protein